MWESWKTAASAVRTLREYALQHGIPTRWRENELRRVWWRMLQVVKIISLAFKRGNSLPSACHEDFEHSRPTHSNNVLWLGYPMYLAKVKRKGRTRDELHEVIKWLTGFDDRRLQELIDGKVTFETFFAEARLNPNARFITGVICGYRVENIENPLTRQVRYLDKLVDELAQGRKMERILRSE